MKEYVLNNDERKREVYKKIDSGLSSAFLGGFFLGFSPLLFLNKFNLIGIIFISFSLFLFFFSRYISLNFLFGDDD